MYHLDLTLTNEEAETLLTHINTTRNKIAEKMARPEATVDDFRVRLYNVLGRIARPGEGRSALADHVVDVRAKKRSA